MRTFSTQTLLIATNGVQLHAEAAGPEDGPLVILLHGFPEYWEGWANQIDSLARSGFRVVAPDQRGYNLSSKPAAVSAYQVDTLARDVVGIIEHFGRAKAVVIGHDWGGVVAWYTAIHHPERVERLVILNAPHPGVVKGLFQTNEGRGVLPRQMMKSLYILFFQVRRLPELLMSLANFLPLKRSMQKTARPGTFSREALARYAGAWSRRDPQSGVGALTGGLNWYRAMGMRSLRKGAAVLDEVDQRVRVPTLVLWGEQDAFLETALADLSLKWVDDGRLVRFRDATHWLHHEEAQRVSSRILDFLEDLLERLAA